MLFTNQDKSIEIEKLQTVSWFSLNCADWIIIHAMQILLFFKFDMEKFPSLTFVL